MSHTLNLKLSESTFTAIRQRAEATGISPADLVRELVEKQYDSSPLLKEEKQRARSRFESHFGEIDSSYPIGADNERIDEELVRAYADTHEAS